MSPEESLQYITTEIQHHTNDGHWLAEKRVELSGIYSYYSGLLESILFDRPDAWLKLRDGVKSDSSADKLWEATDGGKKETIYRLRLKRIEKLMSSMRTMLSLLENELRNSS